MGQNLIEPSNPGGMSCFIIQISVLFNQRRESSSNMYIDFIIYKDLFTHKDINTYINGVV